MRSNFAKAVDSSQAVDRNITRDGFHELEIFPIRIVSFRKTQLYGSHSDSTVKAENKRTKSQTNSQNNSYKRCAQ
uniref:Uncharacterized protein n=1 Tax=Glossina pallidipes TaxID=7398 RepID=A0A1A9ZFY4_GLOPL